MQAMNLFHGGSLISLSGHVGTRHALTHCGTAPGLNGVNFDVEVNSFHEFGISADGIGQGLSVLAASDGRPEAFMHGEFRHLGIMWHPERNAPFSVNDITLFGKFFAAGCG